MAHGLCQRALVLVSKRPSKVCILALPPLKGGLTGKRKLGVTRTKSLATRVCLANLLYILSGISGRSSSKRGLALPREAVEEYQLVNKGPQRVLLSVISVMAGFVVNI